MKNLEQLNFSRNKILKNNRLVYFIDMLKEFVQAVREF